jgi:predicted tellurium resistance membrane protein TerC
MRSTADITMSTDNVLAVAGASQGSLPLLIFGLGLSIPFVVFANNVLSRRMDRYPWIVWLGAERILTDAYTRSFWNAPAMTRRSAWWRPAG